MNIKKFIEELRRRNVFRVATAYVIAAWLIIQVVSTIAPQLNFPNWVPSFITIVVLCGFPLVLIFAWAFELTPDGLKKSKEVNITESVTTSTGKKLNRIIIGVLSIAIIFLLIERFFIAPSSFAEETALAQMQEASIAVLPFADLSPSGDQEYFSDGLSEELLNVLAKVKDLKVAGRTSSFKFKGQNDDLKKIGAELGVNHILEGSVRKSGNQIRVTAQLIKVDDGFHMWSETYDREYSAENLFNIQDEISQKVLSELKVRLLPSDIEGIAKRTTENVEAYEALLKGNELMRNRQISDIEEAIVLYKKAIKLDPKFARAHARVAIGYSLLQEYGSINREQVADSIRSYSDNALLLDSNLAEAYVGLGRYFELNRNLDKYRESLKKAYELDSNNPEITMWYAGSIPLFEEGVKQIDNYQLRLDLQHKAYEIDPLSPVILVNLASEYSRNDDIENAIKYYDLCIEKFPDFSAAVRSKLFLLRNNYQDKLDVVFIEAYNAYQKNPEDLAFMEILAQSAFDFGLSHIFDEIIKKAKKLYPDNDAINYFESLDSEIRHDYDEYYGDLRARYIKNSKEFGREVDYEFLNDYDLERKFYEFIEQGELQDARQMIETEWPEYLQDTLTDHPTTLTSQNVNRIYKTNYVQYVLERTGNKEQAKFLGSLPCTITRSGKTQSIKDLVNENENNTRVKENYCLCLVSKKNYEGFAKIVTELYDKNNLNLLPEFNYFDDITFKEAMEHPKVKPIFDRMASDLAGMNANVIQFLKDEGEWPENYYLKQ